MGVVQFGGRVEGPCFDLAADEPVGITERHAFQHFRINRFHAVEEAVFFVFKQIGFDHQVGQGIAGDGQHVPELLQGRVRLKIGSLYGALDRLVGGGLIELDREEAWQVWEHAVGEDPDHEYLLRVIGRHRFSRNGEP